MLSIISVVGMLGSKLVAKLGGVILISLITTLLLVGYVKAAEINYIENKGKGYIEISGNIYGGDYEKLEVLSKEHPDVTDVILANSGGGNAYGGWKLAEVIRYNEFNTYAFNMCASSCTHAFMGGVERIIYSKEAALRFHPPYSNDYPKDITLLAVEQRSMAFAISEAIKWTYYTTGGKEWETISLVQDFYNKGSPDELVSYRPQELLEAGIVTRIIK